MIFTTVSVNEYLELSYWYILLFYMYVNTSVGLIFR